MFENLRPDLSRNLQDYGRVGFLRKLALCLTLNSIHALLLLRCQQWCAKHRLPTIVPAKLLFWFFKIEISKQANIGPGLRLPHPMGIIIAPNVTVGAECDFYADVRLVLSHGDPQGPRLGDHVFLGDGAKVLGNVTIGEWAEIGASAVVTKDIPAHAVAAGIPARVLKQKPPVKPA